MYFIFSVYINLIFSFIAIVFNSLIFLILSSKLIPKEFQKMYIYMKINSVLNILYVLVKSLQLIHNCVNEDFFCSTIHFLPVNIQYFNIIFIKIIGNTFQSASHLTQIAFTLFRYATITNSKSIFLIWFHKVLIGF